MHPDLIEVPADLMQDAVQEETGAAIPDEKDRHRCHVIRLNMLNVW